MRKLRFIKIWLVSETEKAARAINLDYDKIVVSGDNGRGKSSLVKSLYHTLGAEPARIHGSWVSAEVTSLLHFSIDETKYFVLRKSNIFAIFDARGDILGSYSSIVSGIGPELARLLDFEIEIATKTGHFIVPPPAFCFLPFYIDQDVGWTEAWSSFKNLTMIPRHKDEFAAFHTGLRPKEYYYASARKRHALNKRSELLAEKAAFDRAVARLEGNKSRLNVGFNPTVFADRINELLSEQNSLQSRQDIIKARIAKLQAQRVIAREEMEVASGILNELERDVAYVERDASDEIICPICNTVHSNDFANRFGLMNDADSCRSIYLLAQDEVRSLDKDIEREFEGLRSLEAEFGRINVVLSETRGQVMLQDMLRSESRRLAANAFSDELGELLSVLGRVDAEIEEAESAMKSFENKKRQKAIVEFYAGKFACFAKILNVDIPSRSVLSKVRPKLEETGSAMPRLLLAYYYAILHTVFEFSTSSCAPIVLDTPLQQDPDEENASAMIEFALSKAPTGAQLILATGNLHGVETSAHQIELTQKEKLLNESDFEECNAYVSVFLDRMIGEL